MYFTVVELLIYAASASEHRSRRGVVTLTYTDPSGERERAYSIRVFRKTTTPRSVLGDYHGQEPGSDPFNDLGRGRGCNKFVPVLGGNGTKVTPTGDIFDQPSGQMR